MTYFFQPNHMSFPEIISEARDQIHDRCQREIPPLLMNQYASEANIDFARRSETVRGSWSRALIAGESEYRLPVDCVRPTRVAVQYDDEEDQRVLLLTTERRLIDGVSRTIEGRPCHWYVKDDRSAIGIYPKPTSGGALTRVSAGTSSAVFVCNVTGGTVLSTTDDFYVDQAVRILDGALQGEESVVTDYVGSSKTFTVSPAFTGTPATNVRIEIGNDTLDIQYVKAGNAYTVLPTTSAVSANAESSYNKFRFADFLDRPVDFLKGCEVVFTLASRSYAKTRILSSIHTTTYTEVVCDPELWFKPTTTTDTIEIRDVPNTPSAFHPYLVDYIVARVMRRYDKGFAQEALMRYEKGIVEAKKTFEPIQGEEYVRVREHSYGGG